MPPRPPLGPDLLKGMRWGFGAAAFWVGFTGDIGGYLLFGPRDMHDENPGPGGIIPPRAHDWGGWTLICGPSPSPTPSVHGNVMQWKFYGPGGGCATPQCTIAGQSVTLPFENAAAIVSPGADCARLWQGPAPALLPLRRYYLVEQRSRPGGGAVPGALSVPTVVPYRGTIVAVGQPVRRPGMVSVGVSVPPVSVAPYMPLPVLGFSSDRGYRAPGRGWGPIGIPIYYPPRPVTDPETGETVVHPIVKPYPGYVDVKSPPYDREVKMADASGRMATMFKALSFWGSSNSIIDALWKSLPSYARSPHARTGQKYADVFRAFGTGEINAAAFGHALSYWLGYKTAGALFGTAFRAAEGLGHGGYQLYRAWATGEYVGSGIGVLFHGTDVERATAPSSRSAVSYRGARTLERAYHRDRARIERQFRRGFNGETRQRKTYAAQRRARSIRALNARYRRSLIRHGHTGD